MDFFLNNLFIEFFICLTIQVQLNVEQSRKRSLPPSWSRCKNIMKNNTAQLSFTCSGRRFNDTSSTRTTITVYSFLQVALLCDQAKCRLGASGDSRGCWPLLKEFARGRYQCLDSDYGNLLGAHCLCKHTFLSGIWVSLWEYTATYAMNGIPWVDLKQLSFLLTTLTWIWLLKKKCHFWFKPTPRYLQWKYQINTTLIWFSHTYDLYLIGVMSINMGGLSTSIPAGQFGLTRPSIYININFLSPDKFSGRLEAPSLTSNHLRFG